MPPRKATLQPTPAAEPSEPLDRFLDRKGKPVELISAFGAYAMRKGWHRATPAQWEQRLADFATATP